ncbi:MAG: 50S ribosomal protein L19 [Omnitrophica bacterium RIFCSPLOWO2_01_FULL_45_10]|nr:MAG: 50S ribosomal protein L19 [Omnitrophica bacterium RIFCSPLOWO2_01_FULL_45_10]
MEKHIKLIESKYLKKDIPKFDIGDTVSVQLKIVEEGKGRLQAFEGTVIARAGSSLGETFTVRKISYGEGVEAVFPIHSPSIDNIAVVKKGSVRRAKLYYLKRKLGKESRVEEKIAHEEAASETPQAAVPEETTPPREPAK